MQLIGQKNNLELIEKWNSLPNFIIIQGDEHTGKSYFTLYLCNKFGLRYNKVKNGVNNVRSVIDLMGRDSKMLFHFDNFDSASIQAKNALLKITEEPVPGNYIVITGGPQIKTLESRARKIVMEPYILDEVSDFMDMHFKTAQKNLLFDAGINTPAKIQYYKKYEHINDLLNYAYDIFNCITYIDDSHIIPMLSMFEDRYDNDSIDACLLFLNMLINIIETNIKFKKYFSYHEILHILLDAKKSLVREPTLKRKMLLFKTFNKINRLNRGEI